MLMDTNQFGQPMFFNPPKINTGAPESNPYTSNLQSSSQLSKMIDSFTKGIKPVDSFMNDKLSYENFANPYRETFKLWNQDVYRPEYEYTTLNPFQRSYANAAAASGMSQMGNAQSRYQQARRSVEQPYYAQMESAKNTWEDAIRSMYENELTKYYDSPNR